MLISFRCRNFRSFLDEAELSGYGIDELTVEEINMIVTVSHIASNSQYMAELLSWND